MITLHAYLLVVNFTTQSIRFVNEKFNAALKFLGVMLTLYVTMIISDQIYKSVAVDDQFTLGARSSWFTLELLSQFAVVFSNASYLFLRALTKVKLSDEKHLDPRLRIADSDALTAKSLILQCWNIESSCFWLTNFFIWSSLLPLEAPDPSILTALAWMASTIYFCGLSVPILLFVSWKDGPNWWTSCSPYLYLVLLLSTYIVLPLANILCAVLLFCLSDSVKTSPYSSFVLFYAGVSLAKMVTFTVIYMYHVSAARCAYAEQIAKRRAQAKLAANDSVESGE